MNQVNRYNRQELIDGWDQELLSDAKVALIGRDALANDCAVTLAALGFGQIEIYGHGIAQERDFTQGYVHSPGRVRAKSIAEFAQKINPDVEVRAHNIDVAKGRNVTLIGDPDVIIEATNNPISKLNVLEYAADFDIPVVSLVASEKVSAGAVYTLDSSMEIFQNALFHDFFGEPQGVIPSQFIAGFGVDEARKLVMPLEREEELEDIIVYNLESASRFDWKRNSPLTSTDISDLTVLQIGAGASGNFTAKGFVVAGVGELIIVDYDVVEDHNLNRQVFFHNSVGHKKSEALRRELLRIKPEANITAIDAKVDLDSDYLFEGIDLVVDCVDNHATRALLNYLVNEYGVPYLSVGTSTSGGQVSTVFPGRTACLDCQTGIDDMALASYNPASCIYAPDASVINTNKTMGSALVGEAIRLANGKDPLKGIIKYSTREDLRFGVFSMQGGCKPRAHKSDWMEKMGHLYGEQNE